MDEVRLLPLVGALLYWAEGAKFTKHKNGQKNVEFTNTDPRMIKVMMKFFREVMSVPKEKIRIVVRINKEGHVEKAKKYWADVTAVALRGFRTPELLTPKKNSRSLEKHPHGMCRIVVYNSLVARKIGSLIEEFYKRLYAEL